MPVQNHNPSPGKSQPDTQERLRRLLFGFGINTLMHYTEKGLKSPLVVGLWSAPGNISRPFQTSVWRGIQWPISLAIWIYQAEHSPGRSWMPLSCYYGVINGVNSI